MPVTQESLQTKLGRNRPGRVHLTYKVEIGDAIEIKELPFILGVLGDFSGKSNQELPRLKDREFVEIDRDNFDQVLAASNPALALRVKNLLTSDDAILNIALKFSSLEDFDPDKVVAQVEPLRKLMEARQCLTDLLSKMDGNDRLEDMLIGVMKDSEAQRALGSQLGLDELGLIPEVHGERS